jgi:hypothetical protein
MPQHNFLATKRGVIVSSFATGTFILKIQHRIRNDDDALAEALYLERNGKLEEAEKLLERWIQRSK